MLDHKFFDGTDYSWWKSSGVMAYLICEWKKNRRVFRVNYGWQEGLSEKEVYKVIFGREKTRGFRNNKMQRN